ncbi:hypothetical protein N8645_00885 [bacterium]|nr:hypothetical protein [bacterium]
MGADKGWQYLDTVQWVYLWGYRQKSNLASRYPSEVGKLAVTGSLRLDALTRHKQVLCQLNRRPRCLFTLSSATPFPKYLSIGQEFSMHANCGLFSVDDLLESIVSECADVERLMCIAQWAQEHLVDKFDVCIRPHPYANEVQIRDIATCYGLGDSLITSGEPLWSQLHQMDIMIHAGSTSALEAQAIGAECIQLRLSSDSAYEFGALNQLKKNIPEVISALASYGNTNSNDISYVPADEKLFYDNTNDSIEHTSSDIARLSQSNISWCFTDGLSALASNGIKFRAMPAKSAFQEKYCSKIVQISDVDCVVSKGSALKADTSQRSPFLLWTYGESIPFCFYTSLS